MNKFYKKLGTGIVAGVIATFAMPTLAATTWNMPVFSQRDNYFTKNIIEFGEELAKVTNDEIKVRVYPASSLVAPVNVKNAVQTGQVPIGEWVMSWYGNQEPLFNVSNLPFIVSNFAESQQLLEIVRPEVEKILDGQNQVLLFAVPWTSQGMYSNDQVTGADSFKGKKFRAQSPIYGRVAKGLGAIPVTVEQSEVAQAFSSGVISAMMTSAATGADTQAWDYTKYFVNAQAGFPWNLVTINKGVYEGLDADTKKSLDDLSVKAEQRGWEMAEKEDQTAIKVMAENGIVVEEPNAELQAKLNEIGKEMLAEWKDGASKESSQLLEKYMDQR